jgi:hypothetical protein
VSSFVASTTQDSVTAIVVNKSLGGVKVEMAKGNASRYFGCDTDDIILSNGQIWSACNVGASNAGAWTGTQVWTWLNMDFCGATNNKITSRVWGYFQWWRNNDVSIGSATTVLFPSGTTSTGTISSNFVTPSSSPYSWVAWWNIDALWWGNGSSYTTGTYASLWKPNEMKWPCEEGYHIPTHKEWCDAIYTITGWTCAKASLSNPSLMLTLKLPTAWYRSYYDGNYCYQGKWWGYWTSSPGWNRAQLIVFTAYDYWKTFHPLYTQVDWSTTMMANGYSVRCIKN